jgi:hypothetical protein
MRAAATKQGRHVPTVSQVGLASMVLVGLVLGLLIGGASLILDTLFSQSFGPSPATVSVVAGLIVLFAGVPGFSLWRRARLPFRLLGLGLCAGSGIALVALLGWGVSTGFDPSGMSRAQIGSALGEITSAHREALYLGDEADGKRLSVITDMDGVLFFEYGRCLDNDEGECNRALVVTSQPTRSFGSRGESADGCKRLRPVLGVPAADLGGDLTVFTGSSIVAITYFDRIPNGYENDEPKEAALAPGLRAVGQPTAGKTLSSPNAETQAFVDRHCGPAAK